MKKFRLVDNILGWLTFARSFDDRRLTWRIGMMNKVMTVA